MRKPLVAFMLAAMALVPTASRAQPAALTVVTGMAQFSCPYDDAGTNCPAGFYLLSLPPVWNDTGRDVCLTTVDGSDTSQSVTSCSLQNGNGKYGHVNATVAGTCADWTISWSDSDAHLYFMEATTGVYQLTGGTIHGTGLESTTNSWNIEMKLTGEFKDILGHTQSKNWDLTGVAIDVAPKLGSSPNLLAGCSSGSPELGFRYVVQQVSAG